MGPETSQPNYQNLISIYFLQKLATSRLRINTRVPYSSSLLTKINKLKLQLKHRCIHNFLTKIRLHAASTKKLKRPTIDFSAKTKVGTNRKRVNTILRTNLVNKHCNRWSFDLRDLKSGWECNKKNTKIKIG